MGTLSYLVDILSSIVSPALAALNLVHVDCMADWRPSVHEPYKDRVECITSVAICWSALALKPLCQFCQSFVVHILSSPSWNCLAATIHGILPHPNTMSMFIIDSSIYIDIDVDQ